MAIRHEVVTGKWSLLIEDSYTDEGSELDRVYPSGVATFTPVWPSGATSAPDGAPGASELVNLKPITALVSAGVLHDIQGAEGQTLPVVIGDVSVWWRVEFRVSYGELSVPLAPLLVDATAGPVHLPDLMDATGFPPEVVGSLDGLRAEVRALAAATRADRERAEEVAEKVASDNGSAGEAAAAARDSAAAAEGSATTAAADATRAGIAADRVGTAEAVLDAATRAEAASGNAANSALDAADAAADAERYAGDAGDAATTAATAAVADLVGTAPANLDTLGEIADKLAEQDDIAAALVAQIGQKADTTDANGKTVARYESGSSQWIKVGDNGYNGGGYMSGGALNLRSADSRYPSKTDLATVKATAEAALPASMIQVVTAMPASPVAGTIYFVTGA